MALDDARHGCAACPECAARRGIWRVPVVDSEALRDLVVEALDDRKGHEILALDVRRQTDITDFMVMASGGTQRQVRALLDRVLEVVKQAGVEVLGVEGRETHEWVLVDLGDLVVNLMLPKIREFYELERLWSLDPPNKKGDPGVATD